MAKGGWRVEVNLCWGVACIPGCQECQSYAIALLICKPPLAQQSLKGLHLHANWQILILNLVSMCRQWKCVDPHLMPNIL